MDLSVVVATTNAGRSIEQCLDALDRACVGVSAEVLVVDASTDGTADWVSGRADPPPVLRYPPGTLTPELWAEGYRRSRGRVVALTTGHCLLPSGWGAVLLSAIDAGASAAGGPLALSPGTRPLDWAIYYIRYSGFVPERFGSGRTEGELAGDNAAYLRSAVDRHPGVLADGFWELDVHRAIRADGGWLSAVPAAVVEFGRSFPLATILRHRFAHGRHFGASRVRGGTRRFWQVLAASPLVPAVLAVRAGSRVLGLPAHRRRFVLSMPWFLLVASSWAAGEAWGALREARA